MARLMLGVVVAGFLLSSVVGCVGESSTTSSQKPTGSQAGAALEDPEAVQRALDQQALDVAAEEEQDALDAAKEQAALDAEEEQAALDAEEEEQSAIDAEEEQAALEDDFDADLGLDPTPEKLDGTSSYEFEQDDLDAAAGATDAVKDYCAGAVSEAQRLGCESHVTSVP